MSLGAVKYTKHINIFKHNHIQCQEFIAQGDTITQHSIHKFQVTEVTVIYILFYIQEVDEKAAIQD
jgi:hypothetical protein